MNSDLIHGIGAAMGEAIPLFSQAARTIDSEQLKNDVSAMSVFPHGAFVRVVEVLKRCNPVSEYCYKGALKEIQNQGLQRVELSLEALFRKLGLSDDLMSSVLQAIQRGEVGQRLSTGEGVFSVNEVSVEKLQLKKLNLFVSPVSIPVADPAEEPNPVVSALKEQQLANPALVVENLERIKSGQKGPVEIRMDYGVTVGVLEENDKGARSILFEDSLGDLGFFTNTTLDVDV